MTYTAAGPHFSLFWGGGAIFRLKSFVRNVCLSRLLEFLESTSHDMATTESSHAARV